MSTDLETEVNKIIDPESPDDTMDVEQSPEDAVLDALDLSEDQSTDSNATIDESKPEDVAEAKKQGISDADLEPLNSKNTNTNERFQKVTEGFKQEKQRADNLQEEVGRYKQSFDALQQLGFNDAQAANDLVDLSAYRKVLATGDTEGFKAAIANQIRQFEAAHGKKINISASALDNFPDLQQKVDDLDMDEDVALELARSRMVDYRTQRDNQAHNAQQNLSAQVNQRINNSVATIEGMQANWQKTDPDYGVIYPHLQAQVEEIGKNYPPEQWAHLIDLQYRSIKQALVASGGQRENNLPLRGNNRMSGKPAPSSPQEAVLQSLGLDGD